MVVRKYRIWKGLGDPIFFDKNGGNGGVLLSVGCHRIDLIPWMFETQITEIMTFATVLDKKKIKWNTY
ncbi:MAG: hypothetical protein ACLS5E_12090 [[Ruminococcus] lactaris]